MHLPFPPLFSRPQAQRGIANNPRRPVAADAAGIDDQVIQQRIVDVRPEIRFYIPRPRLFFLQAESARLRRRFAIVTADPRNAIFQRRDEPDVEDIRQFGGNNIARPCR